MACYCLSLKDQKEFFSLLKDRDPDIIRKMVKCIISAKNRNKDKIDIFDITFKNMDELTFTIERSQYEKVLGNCMGDLIAVEEYELCSKVQKIIKPKTKKQKTSVI